MINENQLLRYSRHILLDKIDIKGQEAIIQSSVLVVGCGGLAHPALIYLVSSGVGHVCVVDDDVVELSNLQRQFLFTDKDIGHPKARVLQQKLITINKEVNIDAHVARADEQFLLKYMPLVDVVLDCTDNLATRRLINRVAFICKKPLVSASALMFTGQLAVYDFRQGTGPCYQCLFDEHFDDQGASCAKHGVFSPLLGMMGAGQANEAIKILVHLDQYSLTYVRCFNALTFQWQQFQLSENPLCPICGAHQTER